MNINQGDVVAVLVLSALFWRVFGGKVARCIDLLTYRNTKRFREAERFLASLTAEQILICQGYALYNSGLSALLWSLGNAKGAVFCLDIAPTIKRYPVLLREAMKSKVFEELKE